MKDNFEATSEYLYPTVNHYTRFVGPEDLPHAIEIAGKLGMSMEVIVDPKAAGDAHVEWARESNERRKSLGNSGKKLQMDETMCRATAEQRVKEGDALLRFTIAADDALKMQPFYKAMQAQTHPTAS